MKKIITVFCLLLSLMAGCSTKDNEIVVGASPTPHAEILEFIKPMVKKEGYSLKIKVLNDYVTPNLMLSSGELDANYFQHEPYLNDFNLNNGTNIISAFKVHFEPMGIYSNYFGEIGYRTLKKDENKIIIPNDTSNKERAMKLLERNFDNLSEYKIIEAEAQSIPALLPDCLYACINGNYALSAQITEKCIVTEKSEDEIAQKNANIIATTPEKIDSKKIKVLKKCLLSSEVKEFIKNRYGSSVIAMF